MSVESFPCIKCGGVLTRANDDYEGQPDDGIMCQSYGNYGSTVFDPEDMSFLAFNICDDCVKVLAKQGRLWVTRSWIPITTDYLGVVGRQRVERPYIPWKPGLPGDSEPVYFPVEDLEKYKDDIELFHPIEKIKLWIEER